MKDAMPMVSELRRSTGSREDRPANRTATADLSSPTADRAANEQFATLRLLHLVALFTLPLSLYLVYTHGENFVYRGLLAISVISNLLILARIDTAHARQFQKELQSLHTDNQTNHE